MIQTIGILGATGSIGTQTLSVLNQFPEEFKITLLTANRSIEKLRFLSSHYGSCSIGIHDRNSFQHLGSNQDTLLGNQEIIDFLCEKPPDILVFAVDSVDCFPILKTVYPFIRKIALSSKEILILAGISNLLPILQKQTKLLPLDSEHVAIHQLLKDTDSSHVKKVVLTASGGPFYRTDEKVDFSKITPYIALQHPTWNMGKKVTIDSATLVNKGIELIEAKYLFSLPCEKLDAIIHPQSIIHSFCELIDGSVVCQMAYPNMELPIAYSLFYPEKKMITSLKNLDFSCFPDLSFRKISTHDLPAIHLAMKCMNLGSLKELLYLIADDIAVNMFLNGKMDFSQIVPFIERSVYLDYPEILFTPENILAHYFALKERIINSIDNAVLKGKEGIE